MSPGEPPELPLARDDALFLDFDGTLAPLAADPDAVTLPAQTAAILARLSGALGGACAVISGRALKDLARRVPDGLWRIGTHGLERAAPGQPLPPAPAPLPEAVLAPLDACAAAVPGVRFERKGPAAALHYRAAPHAAAACRAAAEAAVAAGGEADLVVQPGHMVAEVKPRRADKGRALRALMRLPGLRGRRPVMIGDDITDEDAIAAAQEDGGLGVRIGPGASAAMLRLDDPAALRTALTRAARRLGE